MKKIAKPYSSLINNISLILEQGRKQAYQAVNSILVRTYWEIGKQIVEYEQKGKEKAEYGSALLEHLSTDLTKRFKKGFSVDNLENMRRFYISFPNSETLSRKLSWSHYCLLMRLKEPLAVNFYTVESGNNNWSVRELDRQINSMLFERLALSKDKKGVIELSKKGQVIQASEDMIKDPYVLEFLNLEESSKYSETELEQKIIGHLEGFLLELGKGFMFVARQQRITLEAEHFFIDLVFYNRILRCFIIIELKVGRLTHKDLGQLQMYVNYYDREIKRKEENPSVGILLCADKKEAVVRYTLPENNKQLFASEYKLYLPDKKEIEKSLRNLLK
jgi:predicted nuclease of restriction endonuclease-like (RecB) superfamily